MRWLLAVVLLLALVACLEAGQRPRRGRYARLNRKAHTVAGQVKRHQLKQRRRGETANNEVAAVARAASRAKGKPLQKGSRKQAKQLQKNNNSKTSRPARGEARQQRNGAAKKRMASAKEVCLFKALKGCGKRVLKKLRSTPAFAKRCRTKERFLDCMSLSQRRGCKVRKRRRRRGPPRWRIQKYRLQLQKALVKARGCVIGVDLSAATPLTNR